MLLTAGFATAESRSLHFQRHGPEFNAASSDAYERMADVFLGGPLAVGVLECTRGDGALVRYNPATDALGIMRANRTIRTFFKPTRGHNLAKGLAYFQGECAK